MTAPIPLVADEDLVEVRADTELILGEFRSYDDDPAGDLDYEREPDR